MTITSIPEPVCPLHLSLTSQIALLQHNPAIDKIQQLLESHWVTYQHY